MPLLPLPVSRVLLGITGSVTAAHSPAVALALREMCGAEVRAVLTPAACTFVTPRALAVTTGSPVVVDAPHSLSPTVDHVELADWAELVLVLPATADVLAKAAHGLAPDVLTTCLLATAAPVVLVPAMNPAMWSQPAVQRNVAQLRADGRGVVPPGVGRSAQNRGTGLGGVPPLPVVVDWLTGWLSGDDAVRRAPVEAVSRAS